MTNLLRTDDYAEGEMVEVRNTRTGETLHARVDEKGILRDGPQPHGASLSAGRYEVIE